MNWLILIAIFFLKAQLFYGAEPAFLPIKSPKDYAILEEFFKLSCSEEEYGYVLYDAKPISIQRYYAIDSFPIHKDLRYTEKKFINSLLAREAISIWNTYLGSQNTFVLKATPEKKPNLAFPTIQVMFINLPLLERVLDENIALFQANLSPLITAKQLAHTIAYSEKSITEILQDNRILEGIVLGFGTYNSLVGGRLENIRAASYCTD